MLIALISIAITVPILWPHLPPLSVQAFTISCTYGTTKSDSAASCRDIIRQNPACYLMSGYYWLDSCNSSDPEPRQVYCDMEFLAHDGGWIRIAGKNFTNNDSCPGDFEQVVKEGTTYCTTTDGSTIATWLIPAFNCSYNEVHGYVSLDQFGLMDVFETSNKGNISSNFVTGVTFSLLTPNSNRVHLFTYAIGNPLSIDWGTNACKCLRGNDHPPDIVQYDYLCDTGYSSTFQNVTKVGRTLYTGYDCDMFNAPAFTASNCCYAAGQPWFHRDLTTDWTSDIEMRIMVNNASHSYQMVLLREIGVYVR